MPWIGSAPNQTTQRGDGTRTGDETWQEAKTAAVKIRADAHDVHDSDINDMIALCMKKDGGNYNADADLNGNKFVDVGDATARTHFAAAGQVANSSLIYAGTSAGTDTITATLTPAITAYAAGQRYHFKAGGTNTGAASINFNSVGAGTLRKGPDGATALAAGDITTGGMYTVEYDGTNFQLLNPKFPAGFATTDTPQFTAINVGAASDTTLSRASAGDLQIEANIIYRAGGTDVAIADGGTGASTAANAFTALKQDASDTATGVLEIAVQSEMETGTSTTLAVTPGRQHFHPSAAKCWGYATVSGGTPTLQVSYNITSITDTGLGAITFTIANDFSSVNFNAVAEVENASPSSMVTNLNSSVRAAGAIGITSQFSTTANSADPGAWHLTCFGDL